MGATRWQRLALAVALGLGLGFGLYQLGVQGFDGDAYWNAALRLRAGEPLYIGGTAYDPLTYRYPPWFAWAWLPATWLPHDAVMAVWRVGMVLTALALVPPLLRTWAGRLGLALALPSLLAAGWMGNVQPAVVALTVYGLVGVAAGLKVVPLLVPLLRRDWRSLALQGAIAAALWSTLLLYDLSGYPAVRGFWPTDLAVLLALLVPARLPRRVALPVVQVERVPVPIVTTSTPQGVDSLHAGVQE